MTLHSLIWNYMKPVQNILALHNVKAHKFCFLLKYNTKYLHEKMILHDKCKTCPKTKFRRVVSFTSTPRH